MVIVTGRNPTVFIHEKDMIVSLAGLRFEKTPLSRITEAGDKGLVLKRIVSRCLQKLTELGISFSINVSREYDAEDEDWSYALVRINVEFSDLDIIHDEVIRYAYAGVDPLEATKVLLVLENV